MDQAEQLRNMVRQSSSKKQERTARVITVTSGKGGVGKSNVSVNLAVQFSKLGKKVIVLDADFGLANVEVMFGAIPKFNLSDLIYKGKNIKEIIAEGPMDIGFISGGSGIVGLSNLTKEQIRMIVTNMEELDSIADVIIVDTGAGITDGVLDFVMASSEVLLVITPEPSSFTDSYSLLKVLSKNPSFVNEETKIRVISNKSKNQEDGKAMFDKINSVVERFLTIEIEYLGAVPRDAHLEEAVMRQKPVSLITPSAKSAKAFETIAARLSGTEEEKVIRRGISKFFSRFISR